MPDQKGTTTTAAIWQDNHSGRRRHKLMTKELGEKIPPSEPTRTPPTTTPSSPPPSYSAPTPAGAGTSPSGTARPACASASSRGSRRKLGYFDLTELAETTVFGQVPAVERDLYWEPKTLGQIKSGQC